MSEQSVHVEVHCDRAGYWAQVREWPGCFATGRTWEELIEALEESIGLYVTPAERPEPTELTLRIVAMELEIDADRPLLRHLAETSKQPLAALRLRREAHSDWPLRDLRRRGEE